MTTCCNAVYKKTALTLLLAVLTVLGLSSSSMAQLNVKFEIDGNAYDSAAIPGEDWSNLYFGTGSAAIWTGVIVDYGIYDSTRFGEGTKDIQDITSWAWQKLPPNDKVDVTNAQAALYLPPATTDKFLYMEADRFSNDGDAAMGLWLLQDPNFAYNADGTFSGQHVAGTPGPGGAVGDLLVLAHYTNGGVVDSIAIYEWVGSGGNSDNLFGSQGSDAFDVVPKDSTIAFGRVNKILIPSPWPYVAKDGTIDSFPPESFFEAGLDLGQLLGGALPCFSKFLFETRESQSLTASLKDFGLGTFSTIPEITVTPDTVCPGETSSLCVDVVPGTGIPPFTYHWLNGETTQCISPTEAGVYGVYVTGDNGCSSDTLYDTLVVRGGPQITCPANDTIQCTASTDPSNTGEPTVDVPCPPYTITHTDVTSGTCPTVITRTWIVVDNFANADTCEQTITVVDTTKPVLVGCPANTNVQCYADIPSAANVTATDNCSTPTVTYTETSTNGTSSCNNVVSRKWVAVDDCGNKDSCMQTITVNDTTDPIIAGVGADGRVECPGTPSFSSPTATDNCDASPTLTYNDVTTPGSCPAEYSVTRTWTATDDCGNDATASQTITVYDATAPVISGVGADDRIECPATPSFSSPTATDACDATPTLTFADVTTPGSCPEAYSVTRTWTATDDCGNSSQASQTITVYDATAPVISGVGADYSVECPNPVVFSSPTATDNCDANVDLTFVDVPSVGSCPATITRTWTATDDCGNTAQASQTITVTDHTAPILSGCPDPSVTVQCLADVPAAANVTANDACTGPLAVTFTETQSNPGSSCNNVITRSWRAEDACGNFATCSQTITVNDNTAPVLTGCPDPIVNVQCLADVPPPANVTANDNCLGAISPVFTETQSNPGSSCNNIIERSWRAEDLCGNYTVCNQVITVNDNTAPVLTGCPDPIVNVQCLADVPAPANVTANDNCLGAITPVFTETQSNPGSSCNNVINRSWRAEDLCGNYTVCNQVITVNDNIAPVLTGCPTPTVNVTCYADVPAAANVTASDNCSVGLTPIFSESQTNPESSCNNVITRTWRVTDLCGNSTSCSQVITVNDNIAPVLTGCPTPTVNVTCYADVPAPANVTASDNCSVGLTPIFSESETNPASSCNNVITRTWSVTDLCGNRTSCSQVITVNDNIAPVIAGVGANDTLDCPATPSFSSPTATDNCDATPTLTYADVRTAGSCDAAYSIARTWTATDDCGNTATATQTITVQDTTAPTITCAADKTVECGTEIVFDEPTATDACDAAPVISVTNNETNGNVFTRYWVATDACGNISDTCHQTITQRTCGGQITPTNTSCTDFLNGTAGNLSEVCYGIKRKTINNTAPGVFFYYTRVVAPSATFTVDIVQTKDNVNFPYFAIQQGQVILWSDACMKLGYGTLTTSGQASVNITGATVGQIYIISVKYSTSSVVGTHLGNTKPSVHYDFATYIGGSEVDSDPDGIDLHNCVGSGTAKDLANIPDEVELADNYPNPFNPATEIEFGLPEASHVTLEIFNVLGQTVATLADGEFEAGTHSVTWNANNQSSGIYFYRLTTNTQVISKKMLLLK